MLVAALEALGADVWEPFERNNQVEQTSPGWAYAVGQADLRDVRNADGLFAVVTGWEAHWYCSVEELADPDKALVQWLAHD